MAMQGASGTPLGDSVLHLLHRAGQVADDLFAKEIADSSLTPRQYAVLVVLSQRQTASQTDIVDATGIDRSTLADIVRRLVERGLLARKRSKLDARAYDVRLTAAGQAALKTAEPAVGRIEERMLKSLPAAKRADFVDMLSQLVRSLGGRDPAMPATPERTRK
jgi:DNA-binding MarR family transcriptional regulator